MRNQIKLNNYEGTVEAVQARATTIKTYDGRRVVIPNAELFTNSVTVNTAFNSRRWEYDLSTKAAGDLASLKSLIVDTARRVDGVLPDPLPRLWLLILGSQISDAVKLHITWWTEFTRKHQMMASHDRVLTAISEELKRMAVDDPHNKKLRAA